MVQFGKYLLENIHEPWAEMYVDYKQLKALITKGDPEAFEKLLQDEIKKVDAFFHEMKEALVEWACSTTNFAQRQIHVKLTEDLIRLYNFSQLNREGFRKIVKKFHKNFPELNESAKFMKWMLMSEFFCDELISKLIQNSDASDMKERINSVWHADDVELLKDRSTYQSNGSGQEENDTILDPSRICQDTSSKSLSVWSLNVCITPALLREQYLSQHSVVVFCFTILLSLKYIPWYILLLSLVTFFQSVFVVYMLTIISGIFGFFYLLITGHPLPNDYKDKRLDHLLKKIADGGPDVICMQELQGTWYYDAYRHRFCKEMFNLGYKYQLVADRLPTFPSLFANSGLAIFSKYEIVESDTRHYQYKLIYDYWTVNRGCQYVKIKLSDDESVKIFNTHLGPSIFIVYPWLKDLGVSILNPQAGEYARYIREKVQLGDKVVAVGDYNMDPTSKAYNVVTSKLRALGIVDIGKHVDMKHHDEEDEQAQKKECAGYHDRGFSMGYAQWKLTCASSTKSHYLTGFQRPQCLDYCFTNLKKDSYVIDPLEVHDPTAPDLQQVSDHDAVLAKLIL